MYPGPVSRELYLTSLTFSSFDLQEPRQCLFKACGRLEADEDDEFLACRIPHLNIIDKHGCRMHHFPGIRHLCETKKRISTLKKIRSKKPKIPLRVSEITLRIDFSC